MNRKSHLFFVFAILVLLVQACNLPGSVQPAETEIPPPSEPPPMETPTSQHQTIPISAPDAKPYPDVVSIDTAPEKRAPYGDTYNLNRLERPFTQDMTYIPDMDISSFSISEDSNWIFVSIALVGKNPNNPAGIQYAVELDSNLDSFGDFLILAEPPYSEQWTADNVKIYADTNRDSAGRNPAKSDAPFSGDGYDKLIHDFTAGVGDDPDLVWMRINAGQYATVQFAFKKSWAGSTFLFGALADAGLKDVSQLDYVDRFTEEEAGSPVRRNSYYPLQALYAVDNTCYQAFGFKPTGFEPKICPVIVQPQIVEQPEQPEQPVQPGQPGIPVPTCPNKCPYGQDPYPSCICWPG